jgi:hypothetical protein
LRRGGFILKKTVPLLGISAYQIRAAAGVNDVDFRGPLPTSIE